MRSISNMEVALFIALIPGVAFTGKPLGTQEAAGNAPAAGAQKTPEHAATIRATSEEVLLDMVARDKRGRAVRDLTPNQIEVLEDGVRQQVTSFRLVEGESLDISNPAATRTPADYLRQVNLVSLVFERLDTEGRKNARDAALDFLHSQLRPNVYIAVFSNDARLYVLQHFTNDIKLLESAIEKATSGNTSQFASMSAGISHELEQSAIEVQATSNGAATVTLGSPNASAVGAAMAAAKMAQITYESLRYADLLAQEHEGRSSLDAILALAKEEGRLPGRKTIIYFTEGLRVTPALQQLFQTTVSQANRSNVSVYSVDARGLKLAEVSSGAAREVMMGAESAGHSGAFPGGGGATSLGEAVGGEYSGLVDIRANAQDNLADLSRSTGGFLIANTNEMGSAMRRIAEDIGTYYVIAYRPPANHANDEKFHHITVSVTRPGIFLQTRSGYFAAPPVAGSPVFAYEAPMLAALKSNTLAENLGFRAQVFHFEYSPAGLQCQLVIEIPVSNFDFKLDPSKNTARAHFSVMALVKGSDGNPLFKFPHDYPIEVPSEKMDVFKKKTVIFSPDFRLPTGRYTIDTVEFDQVTQKASVHRSVLVVPPPPLGVSLSSLSIIQQVDPISSADQGNQSPFRYQNSEFTPDLGNPIHHGASAVVPLYFVIYPSSQAAEKPQMQLELSREGTVIATGPVQLPAPDPTGSIHYVGSIPAAKFQPGRYTVRGLVRQGAASAEEYAFFSVGP